MRVVEKEGGPDGEGRVRAVELREEGDSGGEGARG